MAKLKQLKPLLSTLKPAISTPATAEYEQRRATVPWRAWYGTQRWKNLRWDCLVRDRFTCRMCGRMEPDTSQLVADHIEPHRGEAALFWKIENLRTLCKTPCHDSVKHSEEMNAPHF